MSITKITQILVQTTVNSIKKAPISNPSYPFVPLRG